MRQDLKEFQAREELLKQEDMDRSKDAQAMKVRRWTPTRTSALSADPEPSALSLSPVPTLRLNPNLSLRLRLR